MEWRLKQGPPLAHKNWAFPSRLRVSTGTAGTPAPTFFPVLSGRAFVDMFQAKRRRLEQPAGATNPALKPGRGSLLDGAAWYERSPTEVIVRPTMERVREALFNQVRAMFGRTQQGNLGVVVHIVRRIQGHRHASL